MRIRATPGVMSSFDERGCVVVDTVKERWFYFTGDEAWVWQSVEVTGNTNHLETGDLPHLNFLIDSHLLTVEEDTTSVPFAYLDPPTYEQEDSDIRQPVDRRTFPRIPLQISWWEAAHLEKSPLSRITRHMRGLHRTGTRYLTRESVTKLHQDITWSSPWWVRRTGRNTDRSIAMATTLAAHRMGLRVDLSFGMCHTTRSPAWWCTVPEGAVGRPDNTLAVSTV